MFIKHLIEYAINIKYLIHLLINSSISFIQLLCGAGMVCRFVCPAVLDNQRNYSSMFLCKLMVNKMISLIIRAHCNQLVLRVNTTKGLSMFEEPCSFTLGFSLWISELYPREENQESNIRIKTVGFHMAYVLSVFL